MPRASAFLIRTALLHLLAGAVLGSLLLVAKGAPALALLSWRWRPVHVELLLVGFTLQLAFGVAFWILPRDADRRPAAAPAWAVLGLLNAGVLLVALGALTRHPGLALPGRILEIAALATFAAHAWPRIRGVRPCTGGGASRSPLGGASRSPLSGASRERSR